MSGGLARLKERENNSEHKKKVGKMALRYIVTSDILECMEEKGMYKADLAKKLGTSKANVTQMLDGERNLTIDSLYEISNALGAELDIHLFSNFEGENGESNASTFVFSCSHHESKNHEDEMSFADESVVLLA
jgi:transcriptional regulator with XRE-family HTH domain